MKKLRGRPYYSRALFLVVAAAMAASALVSGRTAAGPVLTDEQLIAWSHDTYERGDWLYAALHLNALLQRNPASVRDNPAVASSLQEGLAFAVERLEDDRRVANEYRQKSASSGGGVGSVHSGLSKQPPKVLWPK